MTNLIASLNYQTRRDNFTYILFLLVTGMMIIMFAVNLASVDFSDLNGGMMASNIGDAGFIVTAAVNVLLTARICGWDFNDKTINYELLAGHSKKEIFLSRVIVSFVWVSVSCLVLITVPVLFCTIINGWGNNADLRGVLMRLGLLVFPIFRTICEMVLLTVLTRNCFASMILGWLGYEFSWLIAEMPKELFGIDIDLSMLFSSSTAAKIITFTNYTMGYVDGEDIYVFETALSELHLYGTIAVGLGAGLLCLGAAYLIFKKRDMA